MQQKCYVWFAKWQVRAEARKDDEGMKPQRCCTVYPITPIISHLSRTNDALISHLSRTNFKYLTR